MGEMLYYHPEFGEQLTLTGDMLEVTMDAVLDNSLATDGVRITRKDEPALDVEVFGYRSKQDEDLEVYPLDGHEMPVEVRVLAFQDTKAILNGLVQSVLVARSLGQAPTKC